MKSFGEKKMVRKMGFITDQAGIMNRYLREQEHWETHLQNTKQFILDCFDGKSISHLAVLGSGWLLDLPLNELSEKFDKITLADVHHPAQIVKKTAQYKNISLVETDLSGGGMEFCWGLRKAKGEHFSKYFLEDFDPQKPKIPGKPDAFISLNLLNQLDILLVDYLKKKNGRITGGEIKKFRKAVQEFHLDWITKKPGCLVTDVQETILNSDGTTDEKKLIYADLPKAIRSSEWTWDFDLSGIYHEASETRMKVQALEWD
jgi:hypothetical protein